MLEKARSSSERTSTNSNGCPPSIIALSAGAESCVTDAGRSDVVMVHLRFGDAKRRADHRASARHVDERQQMQGHAADVNRAEPEAVVEAVQPEGDAEQRDDDDAG